MSRFETSLGYRAALRETLSDRQRRNRRYSLRSFARDLDLSPTTLSAVLREQRHLSVRSLEKVARRLPMPSRQASSAVREIRRTQNLWLSDESFALLPKQHCDAMSHWFYFAILSLARSGKAQAKARWIAEHLHIPPAAAEEALVRLRSLGLVTVESGKLRLEHRSVRTPTDVSSRTLRQLQREMLHLASDSLDSQSVERRDLTSMTLLARRDRLPQAKQMIKAFRRKLASYLDCKGTGDEVYVLAVQLFSVSEPLA